MRKTVLRSLLVSCAAGLCGAALASPFEPAFVITKAAGKCTVRTPDSSRFVEAVQDKAYPYGSTVQTAKKASLEIVFSEGNRCRVSERTVLAVTELKDTPAEKILGLEEGRIDVTLEENYQKANMLNVVTFCSRARAVAGDHFTVDARSEHDLNIAVYVCLTGKLAVAGPHFDVQEMDADDSLSLSCDRDLTFVRLKNIKGTFSVNVKDSQGNPKSVETVVGTVIKIWSRAGEAGDVRMVTILISAPDGTLQEALTYTEPAPKPAPKPPLAGGAGAEGGGQKPSPPEWPQIATVTPLSFPVTTTVAVPTFTPAGKH
jgi:hypothetical protein